MTGPKTIDSGTAASCECPKSAAQVTCTFEEVCRGVRSLGVSVPVCTIRCCSIVVCTKKQARMTGFLSAVC